MDLQRKHIHPTYAHAEEALSLLQETLARMAKLQASFKWAGEDFMAVDIKIMAERLRELEEILVNGDKG